MRYAPIPQIAATLQYQRNEFINVGEKQESKVTHLITPELRLALNPRLQLTTFYQYNSAADKEVWNVRFSWEFQPLSFLYLVYNSNNGQNFCNDIKRFDTYRNELSN